MIGTLLIAMGFTVAIVLAWVLVQTFWKAIFREEYSEDDALAGRRSCADCGCTGICERKSEGRKPVIKEEGLRPSPVNTE